MTKQNDEAHLLSGAYALNAVTPEEAELVESAMQDSEELRSEVVGLTDTAVALGLGLPQMSPPPALRAKLLDAIDSIPQVAAVDEPSEDETPIPPMPAGDHVVTRRRRRRRPMALLALAAAAVVLFGGGFLVQRTLLEPQSQYSAVTQAADAHTIKAAVRGGGTATVSWSNSEHRTAVVLNGVTAPAGKVLQLWSIRGTTVTSAGLYENGEKFAVISGTPSSDESLAVTIEPDGGSTRPSPDRVVTVTLNA
jgi:anti-sigma-K factor RskA